MSSIHVFYTSSSSAGVHFSKAPASFQTRKLTQKAPGKHFVVFRKTRKFRGQKNGVISPVNLQVVRGCQNHFREKFVAKMSAAAAVMLPRHEKRG